MTSERHPEGSDVQTQSSDAQHQWDCYCFFVLLADELFIYL